MATFIHNDGYAAYFAYFQACTRQDLVSDTLVPTDLTGSLANVTMVGGDYSIADGAGGGRELTVAAKSNVAVTGVGTTRHAVLSLDGVIRLVTECAERSVDNTVGDLVNMSSYTLEVVAPVAS